MKWPTWYHGAILAALCAAVWWLLGRVRPDDPRLSPRLTRASTVIRPGAQELAVVASLRDTFALPQEQIDGLIAAAERASHEATDLFGFTSYINEHFDMPAKLRMIELMWRVAYADGQLSAHERHVMWRIADLLHIPQGAYHHARQRAAQAAGVG